MCARSGTVCTNCTPSHIGRCENYGKAARTDEDLVDSAGRPDIVSDQLERSLLVIVAITPIHGHYQCVHNQIFNGDSLMDGPFAR